MYIEVIPVKYSLSRHPYTYFVPEMWQSQVVRGGYIEIPVGNSIDSGIIAHIRDSIPETLSVSDIKPILGVYASIPLFSPVQLDTMLELARLYCIPVHRILSLFFPTPLRSRLDKRNYILEIPPLSATPTCPIQQIHVFSERIFSPQDVEEYLTPESVFIFPDDMFLLQFTKGFRNRDDILILPNDATDVKRSQAWIDIYEKKYSIIFGTRRLLYYNLRAYSHIIYIEDAYGIEQFQFPSRIRTLDIFSLIGTSTTQSTIITSSPTLDVLHRFRHFSLKNIRPSS